MATRRKLDSSSQATEYDTESGGNTTERPQPKHEQNQARPSYNSRPWKTMIVRSSVAEIEVDSNNDGSTDDDIRSDSERGVTKQLNRVQSVLGHTPILVVSIIIFLVFTAAGVVIAWILGESHESEIEEEALSLAQDSGAWFSNQLDQAVLPLFSIAQFATHLRIFRELPDKIGVAGLPGSLPFNDPTLIQNPDGTTTSMPSYHRNVSGVCDDPELVSTFVDIAGGIKKHARMDGILVNLQLAPEGVLCLLHPMNNTEDFKDGNFLDNTPAWGLDLFTDPFMKFIALKSIQSDRVGIAGPLQLTQCPTCDPFFIARLPIVDDNHDIKVDGVSHPRYGFATALIAWANLVEQSGIYESFAESNFEFQLTRTDTITVDSNNGIYEERVVVLAETPNYVNDEEVKSHHARYISTTLETTNNQWIMTVKYDRKPISVQIAVVSTACIIISFLIAYLVYTVLIQKQIHSDMLASTLTQQAKVDIERNMTAYFAHELRNPLSALDSALQAMSAEQSSLPPNTKELIDGMNLCSSFMSAIMNNLLDVRKIEEGKMTIRPSPVKLTSLIEDAHKMMQHSVRDRVEFKTDKDLSAKKKNWVIGDGHRIQQILTNILTNAIKYTLEGSITLRVSWEDDFACFECIDTGPGIPKGEQEKLFERFVQRGGAPGTGLGLSIAKQIVTMMKGTIKFDSDPTLRRGTNCRVLLPLEVCTQPDELSSLLKTKSDARVDPIQEEIRILIMDDIKMNRSMLSRRITRTIAPNSIVTMAVNGEEALMICKTQEQPFDIIICDQYMEEAGGVLVGTDVIFAMRRNKVDAFIVGCSGNDLDEEFFDAGADIVWGKPMPTNTEIIEQWREGLRERNERREKNLPLTGTGSKRHMRSSQLGDIK